MQQNTAGASIQALLTSLEKTLLTAPRRAQLEFAVAACIYRALGLHDEWAYARLADYVTERIGISPGLWYDNVRAGELFLQSSACRRAFREGRVSFTAIALLGRHCPPAEADALLPTAASIPTSELRALLRSRRTTHREAAESAPNPDSEPESERPTHVELRLQLPRSVATYCDETLDLASAIAGESLPVPAAVGIVLAEASTEIDRSVPPPRRVARALLPHGSRPAPAPTAEGEPQPLRLRRRGDRRRLAVALDAVLRRERVRLTRLRTRAEDLLLDAFHEQLHYRTGHQTFPKLIHEYFGLGRSQVYDLLRRARARRARDPIALAHSKGRISAVQSILLEQLRSLGVPPSCLHHWIERAAQTTVRMLRRLIAWARRTARIELIEWSRDSYRPPSEHQVRTTESPLREIARNPDPRLRPHVATEPLETVRWTLDSGDHCMLLELVHSIQYDLRVRGCPRLPLWYSILRLFHLARRAWLDLERLTPRHPHRDVLERDRFECQIPGCRRRAVEVHHLVYRSHQGTDDPTNLLCLCAYHHRIGEHGDRLRVRGRATPDRTELLFELGTRAGQPPLLRFQGETMLPPAGQPSDSRSLCPS